MPNEYEPYSYLYSAAAGNNKIIKAKKGFLHAIIIGEFVSGGIIEVSDHASDGNGNVQVYLKTAASATGFPKTVLVDAVFTNGIASDISGAQTHVTFIYS